MTADVRRCRTMWMNYGVVDSFKGGPQQHAGDYGITADSYTAIPYSQCYWMFAVVDLNKTMDELTNSRWEKAAPSTHAERHALVGHFDETVNRSGIYLSAARGKEYLLMFDLLVRLPETQKSAEPTMSVPWSERWDKSVKYRRFAYVYDWISKWSKDSFFWACWCWVFTFARSFVRSRVALCEPHTTDSEDVGRWSLIERTCRYALHRRLPRRSQSKSSPSTCIRTRSI